MYSGTTGGDLEEDTVDGKNRERNRQRSRRSIREKYEGQRINQRCRTSKSGGTWI
jgi:hypothetical protein